MPINPFKHVKWYTEHDQRLRNLSGGSWDTVDFVTFKQVFLSLLVGQENFGSLTALILPGSFFM